MSFTPNSSSEMGRQNRQQSPEEDASLDPTLQANDDVPLDLSMPRYPNTIKVPLPRNPYFSTVRNKPPALYDVDVNDQPIDYSKKSFTERESKVDPYGDYAETDLDQPTDYSLRYAEDDTDDEEKQNSTYFAGNEQEDTVKTYCTEGTPYETPLNFSTATSMSDLRLVDSKEVEGAKKIVKKIRQEGRNGNELIVCTKEKDENAISAKESKNMNNELVLNSSGASIEKPVNYYEEGTPGRISRVSSLSSLGDAVLGQNGEVDGNAKRSGERMIAAIPVSPIPSVEGSRKETGDGGEAPLTASDYEGVGDETAIGGDDEEKGDTVSVDKEGKVVTFGGEDHYAEQTPLMFSRSSSLGSLSGFEQQSIHDDRSSIVSDFSRRTSGVVSPSELPDSPSQTVPPSPRHNQPAQSNDFSPQAPPLRQFHYVKSSRVKCSVFEDNIAAFKEESTPIEFSAATSLSSLTIDDEPKMLLDSKENSLNIYPEKARTIGRSAVVNNTEIIDRNGNRVLNDNHVESRDRETYTDQVQVSDGDEDDEDILAACISIGMRTSMYREPLKKNSDIKEKSVHRISAGSATNLVRYQTSSTLDRLEAGISVNSNDADISLISSSKVPTDVVTVPTDTVHVYCTEDTPADISPVGSQSNLSALSMSSIHGDFDKDEGNRLSSEEDDNWILTGDDEKILEECILSGIPKAAGANNSIQRVTAVPDFNSPSRVSPMRKSEGPPPRRSNARGVSSASPLTQIENNEISIHRTSFNTWRDPTESSRRPVNRHNNPYTDCSNQSDDDAHCTPHCTQSAVPKTKPNSLPFVNSSRRPRKSSKPLSRRPRMNDGSSHVVTQVFRGNVTKITITQSHEPEELFTDSSSGSDEEEDLILAQCIRSGMPKA